MDNPKTPPTGESQETNPRIIDPIDPTSLVKGVVVGTATAFAFGMGGFLLIYDELGSMGAVLFLLLPFATGFATALVTRRWNIVIASLIAIAQLLVARESRFDELDRVKHHLGEQAGREQHAAGDDHDRE